ncbi:MAG TPA: hypothetical protein VLG40_04095 [Candidatus Saccharimonas sp.]|nr:hypothetical protein [Candidatus Saccharimonas sp.]
MEQLARSLKSIQVGLVLQFLLGLALGTLAPYDATSNELPSPQHNVLLIAHIVVAFGLLINAVLIMVRATKQPGRRWTVIGWAGLGSVIVALAGGVLTITTVWSEFFTFVMGLGFIVALVIYAYALTSARSALPRSTK